MRLKLWNSLRGRAVQPALAPTIILSTEFEDEPIAAVPDNEPPSWHSEFASIAGFACVISYRDSKGAASQRLITCQRKDQSGAEVYIWAWCHGRNAVRQFRLSRIDGVFDAATGEDLGHPDSLFEGFETDRSQRTQPGWGLHVRLRADLIALLNVLVFLAKCDRHYHPLERALLEEIVCRFWLRCEARGEPDCAAILDHADRLAPDAETFYVALDRCVGNPVLVPILRSSARAMIDADGRIAPEEAYWGSQIDEYLAESRPQ